MPQPEQLSGAKFSRRNQCVAAVMFSSSYQPRHAAADKQREEADRTNTDMEPEQRIILLLQVKSPSTHFLLQTPS